jgi:hypothetical protein
MRIVTVVSLVCMAGALTGCGMRSPGNYIEFVASNTDSVLLDFPANPPGELALANDTAVQQCQIFNRDAAVLESLNVRGDGLVRATYLCKSTTRTADASTTQMRRRQ